MAREENDARVVHPHAFGDIGERSGRLDGDVNGGDRFEQMFELLAEGQGLELRPVERCGGVGEQGQELDALPFDLPVLPADLPGRCRWEPSAQAGVVTSEQVAGERGKCCVIRFAAAC